MVKLQLTIGRDVRELLLRDASGRPEQRGGKTLRAEVQREEGEDINNASTIRGLASKRRHDTTASHHFFFYFLKPLFRLTLISLRLVSVSYTTLPASALPRRDEVPPSDANVAAERPGVAQREDGCGGAQERHGTPSAKRNSRLVIQVASRQTTGAQAESA